MFSSLMFISPFLSTLFSTAKALEVELNSPCHSTCGGGNTPSGAITCQDSGYNTTDIGRQFEACLECESTSTVANPTYGNDMGKSDLYWFMFNMKYTLEDCLFQQNSPSNTSVLECFNSCNPLAPVLLDGWHTPPAYRPLYDYCSSHDNVFLGNVGQCTTCLKGQPGSIVLGNFLDAMRAACGSKPNATAGQILKLPGGGLFSLDTAAASTTTTATNATAPSSTPTNTSHSSGLSMGASVGIGVGIGVGGFAVLAALGYWCLRRRRQRKLQSKNQGHSAEDAPLPSSWERQEMPAEERPTHYHEMANTQNLQNHRIPTRELDSGAHLSQEKDAASEAQTYSGGGSVSAELDVPRTPVAELDGYQRNGEFREER